MLYKICETLDTLLNGIQILNIQFRYKTVTTPVKVTPVTDSINLDHIENLNATLPKIFSNYKQNINIYNCGMMSHYKHDCGESIMKLEAKNAAEQKQQLELLEIYEVFQGKSKNQLGVLELQNSTRKQQLER